MRGFRIKFRAEEIIVTPTFLSTALISYSSIDGFQISVGGINGHGDESVDVCWIKSDMHIGESIEIEIVDANKNTCSTPIFIKEIDPNPLQLSDKQKEQMLHEYLNKFHTLESLLKQKGLL
ncbi:MAG: hypothetical protein ACRDDZ_11610 [Marinifilaceae bacterium]